MRGRYLVALFLIGCSAAASAQTDPSKQGVLLRLLISAPMNSTYMVHRVWKAVPNDSGNGNQVHDLTVQLTARPLKLKPDGGAYFFTTSILKFAGKDLSGGESGHLKQVAPNVQEGRLSRNFTSLGPTGTWQVSAMGDSGWAGMMASKSIGLYEIGFLDAVLPKEVVHVGSRWTHDTPFGDEGIYQLGRFSPYVHDVKGNIAHCTYRLQSIDLRRSTATVSFSGSAVITFSQKPLTGKGRVKVQLAEKQSGGWVLNIATGLPQRFHASRTETRSYSGISEIESSVTDVVLSK